MMRLTSLTSSHFLPRTALQSLKVETLASVRNGAKQLSSLSQLDGSECVDRHAEDLRATYKFADSMGCSTVGSRQDLPEIDLQKIVWGVEYVPGMAPWEQMKNLRMRSKANGLDSSAEE